VDETITIIGVILALVVISMVVIMALICKIISNLQKLFPMRNPSFWNICVLML